MVLILEGPGGKHTSGSNFLFSILFYFIFFFAYLRLYISKTSNYFFGGKGSPVSPYNFLTGFTCILSVYLKPELIKRLKMIIYAISGIFGAISEAISLTLLSLTNR